MKWVGCRHRGLLRGIRIVVPGVATVLPHCKTTSSPIYTPSGYRSQRILHAWLSKMILPAMIVAPPIYDCVSKQGPCFYPIFTIFPFSSRTNIIIFIIETKIFESFVYVSCSVCSTFVYKTIKRKPR